MKKIFTLAFLAFSTFSQAQFQTIATSTAFEEPENDYAKIICLKNNKTAYLHVTGEDGINMRLYDANHKEVFSKTIQHELGNFKGLDVDGIFESGGNIVVCLSVIEKKVPKLYRLVISTANGDLVKAEQLGELPKVTMGSQYAMAFGGVKKPDFLVRHDEDKSYAVALFNTFSSDRSKRIELIHYDSKNKETQRVYLSTPGDKFKYVNILDMVVANNQTIYALVYGYNTANSDGNEGQTYIATIRHGEKNIDYLPIYDDHGRRSTDGILKYLPSQDHLFVVTQAETGKRSGSFFSNQSSVFYEILRYQIKVSTGQIRELDGLDVSRINQKLTELFGKKSGFTGVLQNFYLNNDGSSVLIFEGLTVQTTQSSRSMRLSYILGDASIFSFDANGKMTSAVVVPKSQILNNTMVFGGGMAVTAGPLDHYRRSNGATYLKGGNQFKSFSYFHGQTKDYFLLNDVWENEENIQRGKLQKIIGVGECDAFAFLTNGGQTIPNRQFVFEKPMKKGEHNLAIFTISDFDRKNNVYATLKLTKEGRKKMVQVVWLQPE